MKKIYDNKKLIILISCIVILIVFLLSFINKKENNEEEISFNSITEAKKTTKEDILIYVDIKGSVKNPGVYKMNNNDRVLDVINKAGGLTKYANTSNINLSQKVFNEMVIYVYNNTEIKNNNNYIDCNTACSLNVIEVDNCIESNNKNLININTATLEELVTIPGIGETRAKSIIEYRENNGLLKNIEDLKNISGIGDSLFDKIKDKITI